MQEIQETKIKRKIVKFNQQSDILSIAGGKRIVASRKNPIEPRSQLRSGKLKPAGARNLGPNRYSYLGAWCAEARNNLSSQFVN